MFCTAFAWNPKEDKIAVNIQEPLNLRADNIIWIIEPFEITPVKQFHVETELGGGIEHLDWNFDGTKLLYSCGYYDYIFVVNEDRVIMAVC